MESRATRETRPATGPTRPARPGWLPTQRSHAPDVRSTLGGVSAELGRFHPFAPGLASVRSFMPAQGREGAVGGGGQESSRQPSEIRANTAIGTQTSEPPAQGRRGGQRYVGPHSSPPRSHRDGLGGVQQGRFKPCFAKKLTTAVKPGKTMKSVWGFHRSGLDCCGETGIRRISAAVSDWS